MFCCIILSIACSLQKTTSFSPFPKIILVLGHLVLVFVLIWLKTETFAASTN